MFGIGFGEIVLVLAIILLIYGPDRLPTIARKLGLLVREWKKISDDFQQSIEKEIQDDEGPKKIASSVNQIADEIKETLKK